MTPGRAIRRMQLPKETEALMLTIIKRLGPRLVRDVNRQGADGGWPGFTNYHELRDFYAKHRKPINDTVKECAEEYGKEPMAMAAGFKCLQGADWSEEIGACLYGAELSGKTALVEMALVWFALEETCLYAVTAMEAWP